MYLNKYFVLILLGCITLGNVSARNDVGHTKVLYRRKRYVAFPEGTSCSLAACVTVGVLGQPVPKYGLFTWGMNWAISYVLPNSTELAEVITKKSYRRKMAERRRSRRDLYRKLETILDNMGYSGRECILKTICETVQRVTSNGENMLQEIFRILFTWPSTRVLPTEPLEHKMYDAAQRSSQTDDCDRFQCAISLVDWMKGYYNAPAPTNLDERPWSVANSILS